MTNLFNDRVISIFSRNVETRLIFRFFTTLDRLQGKKVGISEKRAVRSRNIDLICLFYDWP